MYVSIKVRIYTIDRVRILDVQNTYIMCDIAYHVQQCLIVF